MDDVVFLRDVAAMPTERLEADTCTMAAQLAAATCRFLELVGELDARESWRTWGCRSMAHWLSWRCGLGMCAARDHVRVARALRSLPKITVAFARGELSFSKVRALVRVATPEKEDELIEFARVATAAQLDKTMRAYRQVVRNIDPERDEVEPSLRVVHNDDGTVTIIARLGAEAAAPVLDAIEAARAAVASGEHDSAESSRAAALEHVARAFLHPDPHAAAPAQVVVHTDANVSIGVDERGGLALSLAAIRELTCDAMVRRVRDDDGRHDIGRLRHAVPPRLRRAVVRRDGDTCRFPGCPNRHWLHIHHVEHWIEGGPTNKRNLVLLCSAHHRLVHKHKWRVVGDANRVLTFVSPAGKAIGESVPPTRATRRHDITRIYAGVEGSAIATSHGERMDLDWTVMALCSQCPPERQRRAA